MKTCEFVRVKQGRIHTLLYACGKQAPLVLHPRLVPTSVKGFDRRRYTKKCVSVLVYEVHLSLSCGVACGTSYDRVLSRTIRDTARAGPSRRDHVAPSRSACPYLVE